MSINARWRAAVFPAGDALGHRLRLAGRPEDPWGEIVGIVDERPLPQRGAAGTTFQLYIRYPGDLGLREAVKARDAATQAAGALVEPIRRAVAT